MRLIRRTERSFSYGEVAFHVSDKSCRNTVWTPVGHQQGMVQSIPVTLELSIIVSSVFSRKFQHMINCHVWIQRRSLCGVYIQCR